jgi:hypothetical protein
MTNVKVTFACCAIYDRNSFRKVRLFLRLAAAEESWLVAMDRGDASDGSKSDQVDDICERDHGEGYDKNDRVINSVVQHFNNMGTRPTMRQR